MSKKRINRKFLLKYTLLFLLLSLAVYLPFVLSGKSLIWTTDGKAQYYPYLYYMGDAVRDFIQGLFHGDWIPRLYDFSIGMGDDVNAVIRFHPLDFLSTLVPGRYAEYLYQFLVLFRIYLGGLAFSAFCFYWDKKEAAILVGSMIYMSGGYVLNLCTEHPTFGSALIILPLLLLSAEQVMRRQSVLLFSAVTALGFLSNYYFMYICTVGLAFYILLRFFDLYRETRIRAFFLLALRMGGAYLLGVGMTAVVLLPTVLRLGSSARLGNEEVENLLTYNLQRYYTWFLDFITPNRQTGSNTRLNYTVLALPALALLFVRKWRQHLSLKLAFLIELVFLLVPAGGYVMSGFSTVNNRWVFIMAFTVSLIFVAVAEDFPRPGRGQKAGMLLLLLVFAGLSLYCHFQVKENVYSLTALAELAVCTALLLVLPRFSLKERSWMLLLGILTLASAGISGYMTFDEKQGNEVAVYEEQGTGLTAYQYSPNASFLRIADDSFYRTDTNRVYAGSENSSVILGYNGISMYNSIINKDIIQYLLDQDSIGVNAIHRIFSMDGRAVSENLANVKYYMTSPGAEQNVPYGYTLREDLSDGSALLFENQYPLSFGYTYDTWMDREEYLKLTPLERQQVMLEAVVLEEPAGEELTETDASRAKNERIQKTEVELPETGTSVKANKNGYKVKESGGTVTFAAEKRAGCERYILLKGLERNKDHTFMNVSTPELTKQITVRQNNATYSLNRSDYMICLGYDEENGQDEITLTFIGTGNYRLEGAEIWYVPMEGYEEKVAARNQESLQNVMVEKNRVSGTVSLSTDKFMVFSIPWSEGWSVYVDGRERELQKANVMYMGLELEAGDHEIELCYCTPGIRAGAAVTAVSLAVFGTLLVIWIRKKRRNCTTR